MYVTVVTIFYPVGLLLQQCSSTFLTVILINFEECTIPL